MRVLSCEKRDKTGNLLLSSTVYGPFTYDLGAYSQLESAVCCLRKVENWRTCTWGKTSLSRVESQQTEPTHGVKSGNRTWATVMGSECSHCCILCLTINHNSIQEAFKLKTSLITFSHSPNIPYVHHVTDTTSLLFFTEYKACSFNSGQTQSKC